MKLIKSELTSGDVDLVALQLAQRRCPSHLQAKRPFFYHTEVSDWRHRCFGIQKYCRNWCVMAKTLGKPFCLQEQRHTSGEHQFSLFSWLNPQKQPPPLYQTLICLKIELKTRKAGSLWASSWNGVGNCAISTHMAFPLEQRQSAVVSWRLSKDTWIKCYLCLWMQLLQRGIHFDPVSHGRQIYSFCLQLHVGDNKRRDQMTLFLPIKTFHLIPGKYIWVNLIEELYLFILSENFPQEDKQFKTLQGVGEETKDREERNNYLKNPLGKTVLALLAKQEEKQN